MDGGTDLVRGHQDDLIHVLTGEAKVFLAHASHRDPIGEHAHSIEGDAFPGAQRFVHSGRIFRFHPDDLDAWIQRFRIGGDSGDQTAAAHGNENRVDVIAVVLTQDLHGDGALPGDHIWVVEGVHEHQPAFPAEFDRVLVGLIIVIAVQHDFSAEVGDRLHFDFRRGQRHDDDGGNAPRAGSQRDPLSMVAGRSADHAALRADRRQLRDFVVCTANFERKDRLKVFTFEQDAIVEATR